MKRLNLTRPDLLRTDAFIDGGFRSSVSGKRFEVRDPYTGDVLAGTADCGPEDAEAAIRSASDAFADWRGRTGAERAAVLRKWFELQTEHREDLATILTAEQGKPLEEARGEIRYGASFVEWFAEEARRVYGDTIPGHQREKRIFVLRQPVGVAAAITPWNFPNAMITRKVAPALAAGCTVVVKPAEWTPLSALALAQLATEAGIPPGVFNVVTTSDAASVGEVFTGSELVRKLSFTGSTAVGKLLMKQCSGTVKKLSLELGGNAPFIVLDDADIDKAVEGAIASKFRNAGQTCVCANRIFVQDDVYDAFTEKLTEAIGKLKVGDGMADGTDIGPMIGEEALRSVEQLLADAEANGAEVRTGGKRAPGDCPLLFEPTVVSGVDATMQLTQEEIFGPVAPVIRFSTDEEVVRLANATPYGLASYFYGRDHARIWRMAEALEYGMVGINTGMISTAVAPFGGIKESGFGREGSKYGMDEYLEKKYLCWDVG